MQYRDRRAAGTQPAKRSLDHSHEQGAMAMLELPNSFELPQWKPHLELTMPERLEWFEQFSGRGNDGAASPSPIPLWRRPLEISGNN
jgi:hypothetical protein